MRTNLSTPETLEREVISCKACGLVQYRTRTGNCRRCVRPLPRVEPEYVQPTPAPENGRRVRRRSDGKWLNIEMVEIIGQRIQHFRKLRGLTQKELHALSGVTRSFLAHIESGQMTPSLGTLEKISEALGISLNSFFVPESDGETLLEDPFIQGLRRFLRQLDWEQWQLVLQRLASISNHVANDPGKVRSFAIPQPARIANLNNQPIPQAAMGQRQAG